MVELSVVIPTLETPDDAPVVDALDRQTFTNYETLFQDEAPVTVARNEGVRAATADKIVFLDDDSLPRPNYLLRAAMVLEEEAAYAGRTVHPGDDVFAEHFTDHYEWGDTGRYVDRFWGCNMGLRREVLETVGGWDERMGWGHEEKELAERVLDAYDIWYDPALVVEHRYAASIPEYWRKQYRLETRSPYFWRKRGDATGTQIARTLRHALNPLNYLRRTPLATVTQAGGTVARTAGRVRGLLDEYRRSRGSESERPTTTSDAADTFR